MVSNLSILMKDKENLLKQKASKIEKINLIKKKKKDASLEERELADIERLVEYVEARIEVVSRKD